MNEQSEATQRINQTASAVTGVGQFTIREIPEP